MRERHKNVPLPQERLGRHSKITEDYHETFNFFHLLNQKIFFTTLANLTYSDRNFGKTVYKTLPALQY